MIYLQGLGKILNPTASLGVFRFHSRVLFFCISPDLSE